jgi:hypothetical protein
MSHDGHDKKGAAENGVGTPVANFRGQIWSRWPTGITALAVIVLAWVGVYLLWNGIVFVFVR